MSVLDSSISSASTAVSALSSEYKHLDELTKMMLLKLKDIHQQIKSEGDQWFEKRSEILDGLSPFLTDIETVRDNSEELLKMIKRVDAYTSTLEARVNDLF